MIKNILKRIFARQRLIELKFYITKNGDKTFTVFSTHDSAFTILDDPSRVYRFVNEIMYQHWYIDLYDYSSFFSGDDPIGRIIGAMDLRKDYTQKLRYDATTIFEISVYFK